MSSEQAIHDDDSVLIDYLMGQADPHQADEVRQRLAGDEQFARRSERITGLLKVLDCCPAAEPDEMLIQRTVAAAAAAARTRALIDREGLRARSVTRPTFSLRELGAIAALLFVVASILLPSFQRARDLSRDNACVARAGQIGRALAHYAHDHGGQLPAMGQPNAAWMADDTSGTFRPNSRNLWRVVRGGYATWALFQCPAGSGGGPPLDAAKMAMFADFPAPDYISYSYHNAVNAEPLTLDGPNTVPSQMAILADSTPMFEGGRFVSSRIGHGTSFNHNGRGQTVLYLDMHADWTRHANVGVNGDNIWLARGVYTYKGNERPADATDSFLLPNFGAGR